MTNLNIFLENTYEKYNIDEVKTYKNIVKMAEFIFHDKEIMSLSCLCDIEYLSVSFDIVLMNNEEIHRINKEYRKKDSPTDVITFALFADSPDCTRSRSAPSVRQTHKCGMRFLALCRRDNCRYIGRGRFALLRQSGRLRGWRRPGYGTACCNRCR